jgi:hypothetical protein
MLEDLGTTIDIHWQLTPYDEPYTVVILDEVNQLGYPGVLYDPKASQRSRPSAS